MLRFITILLCLTLCAWTTTQRPQAKRDFYQIKIYHVNSSQESAVERFLENAYLPALHRAGLKCGVFKPVTTVADTAKLIYVFIPFQSYAGVQKLESQLEKDVVYLREGKDYLDAPYTEPPYMRLETIFLDAFERSPAFSVPALAGPRKDRVYELRSYEGHTEKISKKKIEMFNKGGETEIFKRLQFNTVFYGEVVAGSQMPNLMYLTTFENKADRDAHWSAFGKDSVWKQLSGMPEYKNTVSRMVITFLYPAEYSDF